MNALIEFAFSRSKMVMLLFFIILITGVFSYITIAKESEPDIPIPIIYVSVHHEGIAPKDAERLILKPLEKELQSIEGLKEMKGAAAEGYASVTLEFDAGFNATKALQDVREKVDRAKADLPPESDEPLVKEVNVALFPVLSVALAGNIPERKLVFLARNLKNKIETLPGVLEVTIGGDREELMEVLTTPAAMQAYHISLFDVATLIDRNNRLVAAGALEGNQGRVPVKVPGVINDVSDVMQLPIKTEGKKVVTFGDIATIRRNFKAPKSIARVGGAPALVLDVKKRVGSNIIEVINAVKAVIQTEKKKWPAHLKISFLQDKSTQIRTMLSDLQNNILAAIFLVMVVIIASLGLRPAILVGLSIPGAFLAGILIIYAMGYTINMVVLFSLILVVGMLVDGAIVTTELAEKKMASGHAPLTAYQEAAKRMAWPITASTATTLAVFIPLIFWPGVVGEFMKYLPLTVLFTLFASLFMALIFIPVLGSKFIRKKATIRSKTASRKSSEELMQEKNLTALYLRFLNRLLNHPKKVLTTAVVLLFASYFAYGEFGLGVEFFPDVDNDFAQVQIQARGNLSIYEKDKLVKKIERRLLTMPVIKTVYSQTLEQITNKQQMADDVVGVIQLELISWQKRSHSNKVLMQVRQALKNFAGVKIQVRKQENGPSQGKPIQMQIRSYNEKTLFATVKKVRQLMQHIGGFIDVQDSRPLPGIEWRLRVDRKEASRFGVDIATLGGAVQMVTNGVRISEYQPDDADEELDIRLRFPEKARTVEQLQRLRIPTKYGQIPVSHFIHLASAQKVGNLYHNDGIKSMSIEADVAEGLLASNKAHEIKLALNDSPLPSDVDLQFKGEDKDQKETGTFLMRAFFLALFLMILILVTQFNSFYQSLLVLSAIIFSTAGVLLGLLMTHNPFGIVMGGIGVIALAGIVVNNNIVLIDTFNHLRAKNLPCKEAILITASARLRPVLLTSVTTVLGLLPMVFSLNIDLIGRHIEMGAPSTQWWLQLSSAIAGGLSFATLLTLLLTPCMLMLSKQKKN